nr:MAG TPA: hypothetical protein [Bacteriophage sp.]
MKIKFKSKGYWDEYFCKITDRLDQLAGLKITNDGYCWRHYILYDDYDKKNNIMAIRIPGGTVGGIELDDNNVIKEIKVNTNYVVDTYPDNVEEIINNEFVGFKVEV